jgi:hypothetical protein
MLRSHFFPKTSTMKKIAFLLLLFSSHTIYAQENITTPKLKAKDLTASQLVSSEAYYFTTLQDFKKLAPNSPVLNQDFSGFNASYGSNTNVGGGLSALIGFSIYNKKRGEYLPNCTLRIGLQGYGMTQLSQSYNKNTTVTLDTLYSASTQTTVYIDSNYYHNISMSKSATNLALDLSLIYNSNPERRFQIHGGIGLNVGAAIASRTNIDEFETSKINVRANGAQVYGNNTQVYGNNNYNNAFTLEAYRNKTGILGAVYFPIGYNFRLSNKKEFLKNIFLFGEFRPAVSITHIPELFVNVNTNFSGLFGIKFTFKSNSHI